MFDLIQLFVVEYALPIEVQQGERLSEGDSYRSANFRCLLSPACPANPSYFPLADCIVFRYHTVRYQAVCRMGKTEEKTNRSKKPFDR